MTGGNCCGTSETETCGSESKRVSTVEMISKILELQDFCKSNYCPSRELALVMTKLDEARHWARDCK